MNSAMNFTIYQNNKNISLKIKLTNINARNMKRFYFLLDFDVNKIILANPDIHIADRE